MKDLKKLYEVRNQVALQLNVIDKILYPELYKKIAEAVVITDRHIAVLEHNRPKNKIKRKIQELWT